MRFALTSILMSIFGAMIMLVLTFTPICSIGQAAGAASQSNAGAAAAPQSGAGTAEPKGSGDKSDAKPGDTKPGAAGTDNTSGAKPGAEKADFVGSETCMGCHGTGYAKDWTTQPHGRFLMDPKRNVKGQGCEECHGPGSLHVADPPGHIFSPNKMTARQSNDLCLKCHNTDTPRHDWQVSAHALAKLRCSDCHKVHTNAENVLMLPKPKDELCFECHKNVQGQLHLNSHHPVLEGKVSCSDCHNVHSGEHDGMLTQDEKSLCTRCHADVRGPFAYEHDVTVNGYTNPCTTCHLPHGSPNITLFKFNGRGLCLQCHTSQAVNHFPGNCYTCHSHIHGSDADPDLLQ